MLEGGNMTTIEQALIESVANLGVGESLLVFTSKNSEFMRFDATANGEIKMNADNGSTQITMSRVYIADAIRDFDLASQISEMPLKKVLLTAVGTFQIDDEEPAVLGEDLEGISSRFGVPIMEHIKMVLAQQIPIYRGTAAASIPAEENSTSFEMADGFKFEITHNSDETRIRVQAHKENILSEHAVEYAAIQVERDDFNLVKVHALTGEILSAGEAIVLFEVVIPSIPFVGQHFVDALSSLFAQIKDWNEYVQEVSS